MEMERWRQRDIGTEGQRERGREGGRGRCRGRGRLRGRKRGRGRDRWRGRRGIEREG